ncbi:MAG: peptide ABC transporter substrate-binding protein [Francisellaceae bacterium]
MKGSLFKLSALISLSMALVACGGGNTNNAQHNKASPDTNIENRTLVVANDSDVPTLDPGLSNDSTSNRVIFDLFEGLINQNQQNDPVPGVAKSWDISDDGLVYTFHLRDDARWSNGDPVTANDFVYALRRNADPHTAAPQNFVLKVIKNGAQVIAGKLPVSDLGVEAIDAHTLKITLAYPSAYFLNTLTLPVTFPLYKPVIDKWKGQWTQPQHIVSNGAYLLKEWVVSGYILENKNLYYWDRQAVKIKQVKILPTETLAAYNQYRAAQVDVASPPPGIRLKQLYHNFPNQVYNAPYMAIIYYWINMRNPEFKDIRVRKALSMVVNRQSIAKYVIAMGQTPAYGIVPDMIQHGVYKDLYKDIPSYDWVSWPMDRRITTAKKLLEEAGYNKQHPLVFTLSYNTSEFNKQIALSVMEMWKAAFGDSVNVKLENEEWKVYLNSVSNGQFDIARMGSNASINAAGEFVEQYTCDSVSNAGGSCIPAIGEYYLKGLHSKTQKGYTENMKKAMIIAMENYLTIPIDNAQYTVLVKPDIGGYIPDDNYLNNVYSKWFYFKA